MLVYACFYADPLIYHGVQFRATTGTTNETNQAIFWLVVEPTDLKDMLVDLDIFPK